MKKLLIFDLDGTLINSIPDICATLNETLKIYNKEQVKEEEVAPFLGRGFGYLLKQFIKDEKAVSIFKENYAKHPFRYSYIYEGIFETLTILKEKGFIVCVLTNKNESIAVDIINHFFPNIFDIVLGDNSKRGLKPKKDGIDEILNIFEIEKREAIYIGDSEVDYETALNSSIDLILCSWGFRKKSDLLKFNSTIIDSPKELTYLIKNNFN